MQNAAVCKKVSSMLSLYIDDRITPKERSFIEEHLAHCDECYKKYLYLKSLIKNLKESYKQVLELAVKKQKQAVFNIREHEKFIENLSPYIDNELDSDESYEFRKYLIKSKLAQKELKTAYSIQKELRSAFNKTQKKLNTDISRSIINKIKSKDKELIKIIDIKKYFTKNTVKIAILSGLMITASQIKYHSEPVKEKPPKSDFKEKYIKNKTAPSTIKKNKITDDINSENMYLEE